MSNLDQIKVSLDNSTEVNCEECGNATFTEVFYIRKISKLLIGAQDDMITNIPTFAYAKCGHINKEFEIQIEKPKNNSIITEK